YFPKAAAAFQSWVTNAKPTSMIRNSLQYIGIDAEARREAVERWNRPVLWPLLLIAAGAARLVLFARRVWKQRDSARLRPVSEGDRS
ncbi:MAG: peptide ABC transporter substrate-binding protein, partial [Sutterella sp.]|nr:peptide ABC transporter substrate-binding protein [Sutterella sp.]